jgi:excisionase family DNA binding protein
VTGPETDTRARAAGRLAVSPREAARLLGCSNEAVYQLVASGSIASFRMSPHRVRIPVSAIEAWMGRACARPDVAQYRPSPRDP